jgi:hypothetical protein
MLARITDGSGYPPPPPPKKTSSSSSTTTASSSSPTSSTTATPPESQAWAQAMARAAAVPPVTVHPGDTLTGIAASHGDSLSSVQNDNPQIPYDPFPYKNLIFPGEMVDLPPHKPAQVVPPLDNDSQVRPIIYAYGNAQAYDKNEDISALDKVPFGALTAGQWDALAQSGKNWDAVRQKTYNALISGNHGLFPNEAAATEVKKLDTLEPGSTQFASETKTALSQADLQWQQNGVTAYSKYVQTATQVNQYLDNPNLSHNGAIVSSLHDEVAQAQTNFTNTVENALNDAANGAGSNPVARYNAVNARVAYIESLGPSGSQAPAFKAAVQAAQYNYQVIEPSQKVADAYAMGMRQGGAQAAAQQAAQKLATVTHDAGDPHVAGQIIQHSRATIDQITTEMGSLAANGQPPLFGSSPATASFNQIYGNLSQSVNAATPIQISAQNGKTSITLGTDGRAAADLVGGSIAANAPKNATPDQSGFYEGAAANAIANGDGAGLSLATAAVLRGRGNSNLASYVVQGAAQGFQGLKSKADSDVGAFKATNADLYQIRTTWTPFMSTNSDVAKAINGYFADHKDVAQKSKAELATIGTDGNAIVEAASAWNTYGSQLAGIGGPETQYAFGTQTAGNGTKDLAAAAASLTGNDNAAAFAVSQSGRLNTAIANTLFPLMEQLGGGGSGWQSWPGWSSLGSSRSVFSAGTKAASKQGGMLFPGGSLSGTTANWLSLGGSLLGLGLSARNAAANWGSTFKSAPDAVNSIYSGLGFGKYIGETYSGLAKLNKLPNLLNYNNPEDGGSAAAKFFFGEDAADLTNSPAFKTLGFFYYGAGAFVAGAAAADDANNGNVETTLDAAEALGNAGNAVKPLLGVFTDLSEGALEEIGLASSGLGLLATAASLGWQLWGAAKQEAANTADNAKFLERGLGLTPDLAQALAAPVGSSPSLVPALEQYARANGMTPGELLLKLNHFAKLNRGYLSNIDQFIFQASRMPISNGTIPSTAPTDGDNSSIKTAIEDPTKTGQTDLVDEPLPAESLAQLKHWAQVLFGNQLG